MNKVLEFVGANLFLFGMLVIGAGAAVALVRLAQLAGISEDVLFWLIYPIVAASAAASYFAGKYAHRLLSKLI